MAHLRLAAWLLALLLVWPAGAGMELVPLPLDDDGVYGHMPLEAGYLSGDEYQDPSIHVRIERFDYQGTACMMVLIDIMDPSQIRTTKSSRSFFDGEMVVATMMAKKARAVFAVNGDFFKYNVFGYTIRQRQEVRKRLVNEAAGKYDVLFIDDLGDFSVNKLATTESAQAHVDALEQAGRRAVNSFTFGPTLVENGQVQPFNPRLWHGDAPMQRVAVAQLGELSYAVFQCGGATQHKTGLLMEDFARMIAEKRPDVKLAYNLDGGGSSNLVFRNEKISENFDVREICDMIYFASIGGGQ